MKTYLVTGIYEDLLDSLVQHFITSLEKLGGLPSEIDV